MAVRLLLGAAGSGKTHHCLTRLRDLERAGRPGIYLVPEQFTYSADRELLEPSDLDGLIHVHVLSFTRLAWRVRERAGEAPLCTVEPAVRPMILRSVIERMEPLELGPLAAMRGRPGLLQQLSRFVGEVRNHGPLDFLDALNSSRDRAHHPDAPAPAILEKLRSLAAVYAAYASRLREMNRRDPEEHLFGLEPLLASDPELPVLTIYVDGFLSWTRRESELLVALAKRGVALEIALCGAPSERDDPRVPFRPVFRSLDQLEARFVRAGVELLPPLLFPGEHPTRFRAHSLALIEQRLYQVSTSTLETPSPESISQNWPSLPSSEDEGGPADAVTMQEARDRRQEVIFWARQIDRWTRLDPKPVERGEIAVLVRDVEPYRDLVRELFSRYEIPYFLDERRSVLAHPRVRLLLGALDVILGEWRRESVIALLRNPLLANPPALVDLLENLSLEYGRNYERWYDEAWEEFQHPPRARFHDVPEELSQGQTEEQKSGDESEEEESEQDLDANHRRQETREQKRVLLTEPIRRRVLIPLARLEQRWRAERWTGERAAIDLSAFLEGAVERDRSSAGDARFASSNDDWDRRVETELSDLLAELAEIWKELPVTVEEFARTLREGLLALRLGIAPLRQDQVLVGDVQRSRVHGLRRVIIGGINDGMFPRAVADDPVLGERDRFVLARLGVPLGPSAQERQEEEAYLFYIGLTRASEGVVLTWTRLDPLGRETPPSPLLAELEEAIPGIARNVEIPPDPDHLPIARVQTARELGVKLLAHLAQLTEADRSGTEDEPIEEILAFVHSGEATTTLEETCAEIERGSAALLHPSSGILPDELLDELYPTGEISSSVSRLQEFAACPFLSFSRSILGLTPRPEARVTPLETGTLAHAALEKFFADPTDAQAASDRLLRIFAELAPLPEYQGFQLDDASRFRWGSTRRAIARFLEMELARLSASPYRMVAREKSFGMGRPGSSAPGLELPLPDGRVLVLRGQIDRMDVREENGRSHVLVIDYKRSARKGLPASLEAGVDLQLAAYLLYAQNVEGWIPAGGLYVPVVPTPPQAEKISHAKPSNRLGIRAHGFVLEEEAAAIDAGLGFLVGPSPQRLPSEAKLQGLLETGRRYLISYATTMSRGWIEPRPLLRESRLPCERCDFGAVCRYRVGKDPRRRAASEGMVTLSDDGRSEETR